MLTALDHANIRTANLAAMIDWYSDVLGMENGPRPDFGFPGAWLYIGNHAAVHLVEVATTPETGGDIALEHVAFRATDMPTFLTRLDQFDVSYRLAEVPGFGITQVNVFDPDGNHLHIDFVTGSAA